MKRLFFLILLIPLISGAQNANEKILYNYATKGLRSQIEIEHDPSLPGYKVAPLGLFQYGDTLSFAAWMVMDTASKKMVCTILIMFNEEEPDIDKADFFCIPGKEGSESFWQQCWNDIYKKYGNNAPRLRALLYSVLKMDAVVQDQMLQRARRTIK